jgi:hypothetical protein
MEPETVESLIQYIETKDNADTSLVLSSIERLLLLEEIGSSADLLSQFAINLVQSGFLTFTLVASKPDLIVRIFGILGVSCNYDVCAISTLSGSPLSLV